MWFRVIDGLAVRTRNGCSKRRGFESSHCVSILFATAGVKEAYFVQVGPSWKAVRRARRKRLSLPPAPAFFATKGEAPFISDGAGRALSAEALGARRPSLLGVMRSRQTVFLRRLKPCTETGVKDKYR